AAARTASRRDEGLPNVRKRDHFRDMARGRRGPVVFHGRLNPYRAGFPSGSGVAGDFASFSGLFDVHFIITAFFHSPLRRAVPARRCSVRLRLAGVWMALGLVACGPVTAAPVLNELFFHPPPPGGMLEPTGPEDTAREWLELHNPTTVP